MYKPSVVSPTSVFFTVQTLEGMPCTSDSTDAKVLLMVCTAGSVVRLFKSACNEPNATLTLLIWANPVFMSDVFCLRLSENLLCWRLTWCNCWATPSRSGSETLHVTEGRHVA